VVHARSTHCSVITRMCKHARYTMRHCTHTRRSRQVGQRSRACNSGACAQDAQSPNRRTTQSRVQSITSLRASSHIRTRLNPLTHFRALSGQFTTIHRVVSVDSTDPQPGVASVNPKPQCAFEELTFAKSCNSRYVSHFAAFFIDPRAE
jgi:hypothetical protein